MVDVKPPGPAHAQVAGLAFVVVESTIVATEQFKIPPVAERVGGVKFAAITIVSALTHDTPPPFKVALRI